MKSQPTYIRRAADRQDYAGHPRLVWRIQVAPELSREDMTAVLTRAVQDARGREGDKLTEVTVFAYDSEDTKGAYTAGRAVGGADGKTTVDLAEGYFAAKARTFAAGQKVVLTDADTPTIAVSRKVETWGDADIIAHVPSGTNATVLGLKQYNVVDGMKLVRYEIRTDKGVRGWVHAEPVHAH